MLGREAKVPMFDLPALLKPQTGAVCDLNSLLRILSSTAQSFMSKLYCLYHQTTKNQRGLSSAVSKIDILFKKTSRVLGVRLVAFIQSIAFCLDNAWCSSYSFVQG